MAAEIAGLILLGLLIDWLMRSIKIPGLIGLLLLGVIMGPYALDKLNLVTIEFATDLRVVALIVILLRAGLELSWETLSKVGIRALLMSFIPCILEITAVTIFAPSLLGITTLEAAMLGAILGAVSPAVVVPLMIKFIEEGRGAKKGIPTLVLAGASCDDAVAIVMCSSFIGIYTGGSVNIAWSIASIPISMITGITVGLISGIALYKFFDKTNPRATKRVLILMGLAFLLEHNKEHIENIFPFASLLCIMAAGFIILQKREHIAHEISAKLGKLWILAQLLLFTLIGSQVDVHLAIKAGLAGLAVIAIGLFARSIGVQLCLLKSIFDRNERIFIGISYLPKATVQAAIGAMPLAAMKSAGMNTSPGNLILAVAVLSIVVTAPTGAFLIAWAGKKFLTISATTANESSAMQAALESNPTD